MDLTGKGSTYASRSGAQELAKSLTDMMPSAGDYSSLVNSAALSVINEGIHIVNSEEKTIFYNAAMGAIEGIDPSAVLDRPLRQVFPHLSPDNSTLLKVLETGEPIYDVAQTYRTPTGDLVTTVNSTMPIVVAGRCVAAIEVAKTISRVRHLSQKLDQIPPKVTKPAGTRSSTGTPVGFAPADGLESTKPAKAGLRNALRPNYTMYTFDDILGVSPSILRAKSAAKSAAATCSPILIWGETGTGKELFAQSIHNASARSARRFVAVNCSALPESLAESMLFGSARGAFTGALDKEGLFEQASGGTLFLDEVSSASPALQSKLLRAVEEQAVRRIGGSRLIRVDVRVIAAANTDPAVAMSQGHLRSDLYYRLAAICIKLPPLRERKEDIPVLVREMTAAYAGSLGVKPPEYSPKVMERLSAHHWPGNVRELRNTIESVLALAPGKRVITLDDLPDTLRGRHIEIDDPDPAGPAGTINDRMALTEAKLIKDALEEAGGNVSRAARALGISRQSLYYRMAKLGMDKPLS
ncbi:MAG: sigma-54 interaction domain-containing protein [Bacillota bacterium]|jgi:arginine utilization regulatory protein|nr:sigma 54-interacting transcriptional regulator [Candidatus Fermentithermobacillaceae bacterium]